MGYDATVDTYMSSPIERIAAPATLVEAEERLSDLRISCLAVTEGDEITGVISRTDLLHAGRPGPGAVRRFGRGAKVADAMTHGVVMVGAHDGIGHAAMAMLEHQVHRVFVFAGASGELAGVLSTRDIMRAVMDRRDERPISDFMSDAPRTLSVSTRLDEADEELERAGVTGLVVVENDWPVGIFSQIDALASRMMSPRSTVDEAMSPLFLCLAPTTKLHRAAAMAAAMDVRRIIVVDHRQMRGILSGLDFARAVLP